MANTPNLNLTNGQINDLITVAEDHGVTVNIEDDKKASQFFSELLFQTSRMLNQEQAQKYNNNV